MFSHADMLLGMRAMRYTATYKRLRINTTLLLLLSLLGSAVLIGLAARTGRYPYVACVGLVPLFVAIRVCRPLGALLSGTAWGLCLFAVSVAGLGPPIPLTAGSLLLLAGVPAVYAWAGALLTRWIGFSPFVIAVGWMGLEAALSSTVSLNHNEFVDRTWISWFGSMIAPLLVGFSVALINAVLLELAVCCHATAAGLLRLARSIPESIVAFLESFISPLLSVLSARHSRAPPFSTTFC